MKQSKLLGLALVIYAVTMWGLVPVGMRSLLLEVSPQTALLLRIFPAGLFAAILLPFLPMRKLTRGHWLRLIAAALIGNMGYQALAAVGIQLIPASWTGMLFGLEPVFIALGASLFASEKLTAWFLVGLLVALGGTAVLVLGSATGQVRDVSVLGVLLVTAFFTIPPMVAPHWILVFALLGAALLGTLGLIAGLWAEKFDQLAAFQNFIIMPLTFLSGVFYSIHSLPPFWQAVSHLNPIFYMIDGFRYGFFGTSDISPLLSVTIVGGCFAALSFASHHLIRRGYKLRH